MNENKRKIRFFLDNLKTESKDKLLKKRALYEKNIKNLSKNPQENSLFLLQFKSDLQGVNNALKGKVVVSSEMGQFNIKESYLRKLKNPEKYIENLERNRMERTLLKLEKLAYDDGSKSDFNSLNGLLGKYVKMFGDSDKFKSDLFNRIDSKLNKEEKRAFSLFIRKRNFGKKYKRVISLNENNRTINYMNQ